MVSSVAHQGRPKRWANTLVLFATVAAVVAVVTVALVDRSVLTASHRDQMGELMDTGLAITHEAIDSWAGRLHQAADTWAESDVVTTLTSGLLETSQTRDVLLASPSQQEMSRLMSTPLAAMGFLSYGVINSEGVFLSSSRVQEIGTKWSTDWMIVDQDEFMEHIFGTTSTFEGVTSLESRRTGNAVIQIGHPISAADGTTIAALIFHIDPSMSLSPILMRGRFGETGEIYAFDRAGRLISESRHNDHLEAIGLIDAGQPSAYNVRLLDPGVDLLTDHEGATPIEERPPTRPASEALAGRSGNDLSGYRDYRGVTVVGAWLWDESLGLGIGTKVDASEAFAISGDIGRTITYGTAGTILLMALTAGALVRARFQQAKRLAAERQFRAIATSAADSIISADGVGTIRSWNPAAEEMFGHPAEQAIGTKLATLMPERFRDRHRAGLARILDGKAPRVSAAVELVGVHRDGSEFPIELTLGTAESNGDIFHCAIIRDISDRDQANQVRAEHQADLEALLSSKDQLVASVSHELRTPLTSIIGFAELLLTERDALSSDDLDLMIQTIASESSDLASIVEDLLVAARTDLESVPIRPEPVDLAVTAQSTIERIGGSKTGHLMPINGNAVALADPNRVRQIVRNLVTNARRYGGDLVHIEIAQEAPWTTISVRDDGEPIPDTDRDLLFEPYGLSDVDKENRQSIGLGLSVSQRLATLMGGTLTYRHQDGESIFELSLPEWVDSASQNATDHDAAAA